MEPIILWQYKWSATIHVPLYLFLGGLTAGLFIIAALSDLIGIKVKRLQILSRLCAITAVPLLALAGFFFTVHLGKPERGLAFPLFFTNYESWMTRGGWVVGISSPLVVLYAVLWYFQVRPGLRRVIGVVGIPFLVGMALYTGFLLSGAGYVPLWNPHYLPMLFLNSGLTTGIAAAGLLSILFWRVLAMPDQDPRQIVQGISMALVFFIILELYELYAFMSYLAGGAPVKGLSPFEATPTGQFVAPMGSRTAYEFLTQGALAARFWGGVIGIGLIIPLGLTVGEFLWKRWRTPLAGVKFALVLVGGYFLRSVIVQGGDLKALLPFPPSLWPIPPLSSIPEAYEFIGFMGFMGFVGFSAFSPINPMNSTDSTNSTVVSLVLAGLALLNLAAGAEPPVNLHRGREIYRERCVLCHGEQGQGWDWSKKVMRPPIPVPNLIETIPTRDDEFLSSVIREGGEGVGLTRIMVAFGFQMDEGEVRDLIGYLRAFPEAPRQQ